MDENNISEYRSDPMVEGGVLAVGCSVINMSSLQPLSYSCQSLKERKYNDIYSSNI